MGVIQVVLSPACLSATPDTALAQYLVCSPSGRVSTAFKVWQKRISLKTMDQKADERWSVMPQRTFEEVGINFQRLWARPVLGRYGMSLAWAWYHRNRDRHL